MFHRFAMTVAAAAFAASSVAPAQVPTLATIAQLPAVQAVDTVTPKPANPVAEPLVAVPTHSSTANSGGIAVDAPVPTPAQPKASLAHAALSKVAGLSREVECLAVGVYFESKSEPFAGQLAVANVIANRANSKGRFPSSYCGVLKQRGQFSFVRGSGWPPIAKNGAQWKSALSAARIVHSAEQASNIGRAMFFHAKRVSPGWKLTKVAAIGNHIFYR